MPSSRSKDDGMAFAQERVYIVNKKLNSYDTRKTQQPRIKNL